MFWGFFAGDTWSFPNCVQIAVCTKYKQPLTKHYVPTSLQVEKGDGEMPFFVAWFQNQTNHQYILKGR